MTRELFTSPDLQRLNFRSVSMKFKDFTPRMEAFIAPSESNCKGIPIGSKKAIRFKRSC